MLKSLCALTLGLGVFFASLSAGPAVAQPQLVEGTNTIYKRILTRPGANLFDGPEGAIVDALAAFQPYYVFATEGDWTQVGPSISGAANGWVKTGSVVEWRQNIVGAFTNTAGRKRQLMFDSEDDLRWLLNHEAMSQVQERLLAEADAGISDGNRGVVGVEPEEFVNIREDLYIMPILDFVEDLHPLNYEDIVLMQMASIPLNTENDLQVEPDPNANGEFDVGIVFVLDTTQSMETYIARTQSVLEDIVRQIEDTEIGKLVNFGAIGFRDNVDAVDGLEYRTKTLAPLKRRRSQEEVFTTIRNTRVAVVNSPGFNEDSLAGVEDAIDKIDWMQEGSDDPIDGKYVILVTDAGPKHPRDANARSNIGAAELQADAEGKGIVIMTLHLKTPVGEGNHDYAKTQYSQLSKFAGRTFYFPIEGGEEEAFAGTATRIVTSFTDHVRIARGEEGVQDAQEAGEDLIELGRAMRLAYLGSLRGTQVPDVVLSWVTDKAVESPRKLAISPRLLITKNEMATMAELLDNLVRLGEQGQGGDDAMNFFNQVRGVVADMATNPDRLVNTESETLGGALEYLERLPYKSQLLTMTPDRWAQSAMIRRNIIDGMRQKLVQYRKWLFDPSVWTKLHEGAADGDLVFAMPFDVLP